MYNDNSYSQYVLATVATMAAQILTDHPRADMIRADIQALVTEAVGAVHGDARKVLVAVLVRGYPGLVDLPAINNALVGIERREGLDQWRPISSQSQR
jgi:hypothetical protein